MNLNRFGFVRNYYRNFQPTTGFKLFADGVLCKLQEQAPDGSTIVSMVMKMGRQYLCIIDVITKSRHFATLGSAFDATESVTKANETIQGKLARLTS